MLEDTLDLKITFKGNQATLNKIKQKLEGSTPDDCTLSDALGALVKQALIACGVDGDFDLNVESSLIKHNFSQRGGLNANEWLRQN